MVVSQQLVQKVNGLVADKTLVLRGHKAVPRLLLEAAEDIIVLCVQLNLVPVKVVKEVVGAEDLGDLHKLVRIATSVEEGLLPEDHGCEHGAKTPHVETVVVLLKINQQFGALEITRRHPNIVLGSRMVEFGEAPVDET